MVFLMNVLPNFGDVIFVEGNELQQMYGGQRKANQASYQLLKSSQ
jgi:hypothetical protein